MRVRPAILVTLIIVLALAYFAQFPYHFTLTIDYAPAFIYQGGMYEKHEHAPTEEESPKASAPSLRAAG